MTDELVPGGAFSSAEENDSRFSFLSKLINNKCYSKQIRRMRLECDSHNIKIKQALNLACD